MQIDPNIILGSAIVGLLVGMTGAGGGALMTPMLILPFGVKPSTAISSDLVGGSCATLLGGGIAWLYVARPWNPSMAPSEPALGLSRATEARTERP